MRIAICASEGAPYCKSGGLGDVMEALPPPCPGSRAMKSPCFCPITTKSNPTPPTSPEKIAEFRVSLGLGGSSTAPS